jgi:hypothetical protein
VAASPDSVTLRVPYAFGVACAQVAGKTIVGLLPADSASYFSASPSGYAWRDSTGKFVYVEPATATASSSYCGNALYTDPPVAMLSTPGWAPTEVALAPNDVRAPPGAIVYLYQQVRYAFAPSGQLPGRIGLWRTLLSTGQRDELVAPFDTSAGFQFLDSTLTARATPPSDLTSVRGLRLLLVAASELPPEGRTAPMKFSLTTDVVFLNRK